VLQAVVTLGLTVGGLDHSFQLAMHKYIGVSADGGGEMGVQGNVQSVMPVLSDVEHASAEVLCALGGLERDELEQGAGSGIGNGVERFHESSGRRRIHLEAKTLSPLHEGVQATF